MDKVSLKEVSELITKGTTPSSVGREFTSEGISRIQISLGELQKSGLADLQTGPFGMVLKASEYTSDGVPVISVSEIREGFLRVSKHTPRVNKGITSRLPSYILEEGDIVFGRKGAINRNSIINNEQQGWFLGSDGIRLRLSKEINSTFVSYQLRATAIGTWLLKNSTGSIMASLNQKILDRLPLWLPELKIQNRIASFLRMTDAKIELNNKINAELEAMAKMLYDYWFVQFDFPNAKGKPYKTSGGKMIWNEELKREIPEGWKVQRIEEVVEKMNSGGTPSTLREDFYNGNIFWYATNELQDDFLISSKNLITDLALNESSAKLFPAGTILIAIYAAPTVGRLGMLIKESAFNQACCGILANEKLVSKEYLFLTLLSMRKQFNLIAVGTAQKNLSVGQLKSLNILVPAPLINSSFKLHIKSMFAEKLNNQLENQKLTELRDWLLPMLMNGQVKVGGVKNREELQMAVEPKVEYKKSKMK